MSVSAPLQIRALPIVEKWDCHGCSLCCRQTTIPLDQQDCAALRKQEWDSDSEFPYRKMIVRRGLLKHQRVLAKKSDGSCVFLNEQGRCRIHERFGAEAKPLVCQLYPFQLVPLERHAYLTTVRSCPSAAGDCGSPLEEHVRRIKKSRLAGRIGTSRKRPPAVFPGIRRSWREFLSAADVLERLTTIPTLPLVRRLIHGLQFCNSLEKIRARRIKPGDWNELMQLLEVSATENAGDYFRDRQPPSRAAGVLLRQAGAHFIRAHPRFSTTGGWLDRWRLFRFSMIFARGQGTVPPLQPTFPESTFEQLERPLGPLPAEISQPLERLFVSHTVSRQYAIVPRRGSLVSCYRELVLTYAIAMWLLRLAAGKRDPEVTDVTDIVVALQRGQGMGALRRSASALAGSHQLERLVAWYAR